MAALLPPGLEVDTYDGSAWAGVVPFWMDQVRTRASGNLHFTVPTVSAFSELNLRTYVRSPRNGKRGVYFFSLDCSSPLAVLGARLLFHLPYFFAAMQRTQEGEAIRYRSQRRMARLTPGFNAAYRPIAPAVPGTPGSLAAFLTERYCLFTAHAGRILRGDIHHMPWPLQDAEAEIRLDQIPAAHGLTLPSTAPVLHFSRALEVLIWPLVPDLPDSV